MKFYSIDRDQMNLNESIKASDERVMFQADKVEWQDMKAINCAAVGIDFQIESVFLLQSKCRMKQTLSLCFSH